MDRLKNVHPQIQQTLNGIRDVIFIQQKMMKNLTANNGPISTSNPRSAKPVAMTFPPLSWPS